MVSMVDPGGRAVDDGLVPRASPTERVLTIVAVVSVVAALALAHQVHSPAGGDAWTDGAAGAWLWALVGLAPVAAAGIVSVGSLQGRRGALPLIGTAAAVAMATVVGEAMHASDPLLDRRLLGMLGAGLDVTAVAMAVGTVGTLQRPRLARHVGPVTVGAGLATGLTFGIAGDLTARPRLLPAVSPLQVPSLTFFDSGGETVLLVLALGPLVAAGLLAWTLLGASIDERRQLRWLALCLVTAVGAVAVMQLVRLLGLFEVGDGFLAALPRAVVWAAAAAGAAMTIIQPEFGDAAKAVRKVAVGVGVVLTLGAAGGLVWFAVEATTAHIVPGAPVAATVLTVAALFVPIREWLERAAERWLFSEVGSDARLIDSFGAAAEHASRFEVLELLVATARRALRLRWVRASTAGTVQVVATAGVGADELRPAAARFSLMESGEQLGTLECGPKRGGPLNAHDRQLLGALGREAALRLRTVSQADELEARLHQIERQAAEIAASRARIVEAQDEERRRIERDIHDGVQQELASLIGKLRLAINQIAVSPTDAAATIAATQDDVRRTLADVRAIAQGIHPAILDDQGVVRAIAARAKRLPLEVSVDADPDLTSRRFDRTIEGAAYFVASEALANIVKHAEATVVTVALALDGDRLTIRVTDDGRGLGDDVVRGSGLTNMADRAAALGGRVTVEANPTGGTTVMAELPLAPTVAA
jgi:signal transduction histidine kinase